MPPRNLVVIVSAAIISLACYDKAQRNRFAGLFAEALRHVKDGYVEPVEERELFEGAMKGMLRDLDPYSAYIGPTAYEEFQESLDQEFGGIGIMVELSQETDRLTVLSPVVDTPAYRAGMRAGDTILEVDGVSTEGYTLQDAVGLLRGPVGKDVHMTVLHKGGKKPVEFTITRAIIQVPSVLGDTRKPDSSWSFLLEENPRIGFIRLTQFGDHSVDELTAAIEECNTDNVEGLIIDLRDNAGGLLDAAVDICDMFIDDGIIVSTRGRGGKVQRQHWASGGMLIERDIHMAVLVNKHSASASEIVAACLQDNDRAVIVGDRSWGKGTVQNVIYLEAGKSILKLTVATYWRPTEKNIHRHKNATDEDDWGVMPNEGYRVPLSNDDLLKIALERRRRDYPEAMQPKKEDVDAVPDDGEEQGEEPRDSEDEEAAIAPKDEEKSADVDDGPFDDPQMRKAIDYIESKIAPANQQPAASAA